MTYSESLTPRQLRRLADRLARVAFDGQPLGRLRVRVASAFYLPNDPRVLDQLAPMILCPPCDRRELIENLLHELVHHRNGYRTTRPHGPDFQRLYRAARRRLTAFGEQNL